MAILFGIDSGLLVNITIYIARERESQRAQERREREKEGAFSFAAKNQGVGTERAKPKGGRAGVK